MHIQLMGDLAVATGNKVEWDGEAMTCTNIFEADRQVRREYRTGQDVELQARFEFICLHW